MAKPEAGVKLSEYLTKHLFRDVTASLVNFAVSLPSSFAVPIASGFPPIVGFLTMIVGAFVVGPLSSCRYQISNAAATMIAVTWVVIDQQGVEVFGVVVLVAGVYQLLGAIFKWARWFGAISPSLVFGLMTGIGAIIALSQLLVILGTSSRGNGVDNLVAVARAVIALFGENRGQVASVVVGMLAAGLAFAWPRLPVRQLRIFPGTLAALIVATLVAHYGGLSVQRTHVSSDFFGHMRFIDLEVMKAVFDWKVLLAALPMAFLASTNSLLAATILDRVGQGKKTDFNRELFAQGVGNMVCGFVGCLSLEGATSKGVANVEAGAHSRVSVILMGVWALVMLTYFPIVLEMIPAVALSGVLFYISLRLMNLQAVKHLKQYGKGEVLIYIVTVTTMLVVDVSTGILVGFFVCLAKIVFTFSSDLEVVMEGKEDDDPLVMSLKGAATFLALPKLNEQVKRLPTNKRIRVSLDKVYHIDYGCAEFLTQWARRLEAHGGLLEVDWQRVRTLYATVRNLLERASDDGRGWLSIQTGPLAGNRYRLYQSNVIGRGVGADINLSEDGVSDQHACVFQSDEGEMVLVDMGSAGGTWVDSQRVERVELKAGLRFRIADTEFEYDPEDEDTSETKADSGS